MDHTEVDLTHAQVEHAAHIEKQNAGIPDLIVVSRTVLNVCRRHHQFPGNRNERASATGSGPERRD
jgi:hypothetical protein